MSNSHHPDLMPHELEALAHLLEECAESVAIIGKTLRHGLWSVNPRGTSQPNRELIANELGHVVVAIEIALQLAILDRSDVDTGVSEKWERVGKYLHHIKIDDGNRKATRR